MTLHTFDNMQQRSPEWYAARCGIVTASVVGKLLTPTLKVADNDTARGVTAQLVAERITGEVEQTYANDDMMRGILHEPLARDIYSGHYEQAVECGFMVRDLGIGRLGYSPDGLVGFDGLLEVKCPRSKGHLSTILADRVPPFYMAQCQTGLLVSGRRWLDFASFRAGMPLYVCRVLPDIKWFEAITAAVANFERVAAEMEADYAERIKDLPATERIDDEIRVA
jgi:hypothetical protein